jgi:glycosyltransferase involved in cell wall biosynthesis
MKVVFVNVTLGSMQGINLELARHLKEKGVEVVILTYGKGRMEIIDGIKKYFIKSFIPPSYMLGSYLPRKLSVIDIFMSLLEVCKKEKVDLIHAFFAFPSDFSATLYKRLTGTPCVVTVAGADVEVVSEIGYGLRLDPIENKAIRFALRYADMIIAPSSYAKNCALQAGAKPNKLVIIPFGINREKIKDVPEHYTDKVRELFKIESQDKVILSVCRLHPKKGLKYLLYAIHKLKKNNENVRVIIVGEGPEKLALNMHVKQLKLDRYVTFTGFVPEQLKHALMKIADIYVLPSLSDSFPISVLEAMSHGLPVIITNNVGLSDFLKEESFGVLVKPRDIKGLACGILRLLENDDLREKMGRNAMKASMRLNYKEISRKILKVYLSILDKKYDTKFNAYV